MGLDCSHGAFHGAYSAFNRLRQIVCWAAGGSFPPHLVHNPDGTLGKDEKGDTLWNMALDDSLIYFGQDIDIGSGLYLFLTHSDCDGEISPEMCAKVADDLEKLLPKIASIPNQGGGHIAARGGFAEVIRKFIAGCREAASKGEYLKFY